MPYSTTHLQMSKLIINKYNILVYLAHVKHDPCDRVVFFLNFWKSGEPKCPLQANQCFHSGEIQLFQ